MATDTRRSPSAADSPDADRDMGAAIRDSVRSAADTVRSAAELVADQAPEVARATRDVAGEAARRLDEGSDEILTAGATLSLGLAIGMLIGGAPRPFVAAALLPVAAMGFTILDHQGRLGGRVRGRSGSPA